MLIVKQMDLRSNIKKYFDLAYNGEAVFIPRKQDRNVVIISEEEYQRLQQANRIGSYAQSFNTARDRINSAEFRMSDSIKAHNLKKLEAIRSLGDNWNGNGANWSDAGAWTFDNAPTAWSDGVNAVFDIANASATLTASSAFSPGFRKLT